MPFLLPKRAMRGAAVLALTLILGSSALNAQSSGFSPAKIVDDEGGPVSLTGTLSYTNAGFFTNGVAQPVILMEDQAGFVDRNLHFLMPLKSQTLGQLTSDFYQSPVSYSMALPTEPQGSLRDVDEDGTTDTGVQVFAIAYWENVFGGPFLEERDLQGGGWSGAYASTRVSEDADTFAEITGGKYVVYAPDAQQGFPSDFGADAKLFTADDPIVGLPQGYTVVNLDTHPFTFSREKHPVIDLIEPSGAALVDYSKDSYTTAFDSLVAKMRKEYAFTDLKHNDWDAKLAQFRPRFVQADANQDEHAYKSAFHDFVLSIPDGHMNAPFVREDYQKQFGGGIGMAVRELDDGRVLVSYLTADSPAAQSGVELKAEILSLNGTPIKDAIDRTLPYLSTYSSDHDRRLGQLAFVTRFPADSQVTVEYRNPSDGKPRTATINTVGEADSLTYALGYNDTTGAELPVEFTILPSGYGLVHIYSFHENQLLTIQLWETMIETMKEADVPGLIVDMRQNGGGSNFLTTQMAAYFFDEPLVVSASASYDKKSDQFYSDPRGDDRYYLPSENLRYLGPIAVLVSPNCYSACEFFSYDLTVKHRATIVGQYPTGGLGGGISANSRLQMPGGIEFQFPVSRPLTTDRKTIIIEGTGVVPDVRVPVNEDTLFGTSDALLDAAIAQLDRETSS